MDEIDMIVDLARDEEIFGHFCGKFQVCWVGGNVKHFLTIEEAEAFQAILLEEKVGSDIWWNDILLNAWVYNPFTDKMECEFCYEDFSVTSELEAIQACIEGLKS